MNSILTELYLLFYRPGRNEGLEQLVEDNHKQLKEALGKPERRLVLEIIDAKDQLAETASIESFSAGFELACRLCNELVCIQNSDSRQVVGR